MQNTDVTSFQKLHGLRLGYTNNDRGVAGAKTLSYIENGEYKVDIFISPDLLIHLQDNQQFFWHVIHHELCHVHEGSISFNLYGNEIEDCFNLRMDKIKFAHAELIWSEYVATRLSIATVNEDNDYYLPSLVQAVIQVRKNCEEIVEKYGSIDCIIEDVMNEHAFGVIQLETSDLLRRCSYVLGYLHGFGIDIKQYEEIIFNEEELQYFKKTLNELDTELERLFNLFPNWKSEEDLRGLTDIVLGLWKTI